MQTVRAPVVVFSSLALVVRRTLQPWAQDCQASSSLLRDHPGAVLVTDKVQSGLKSGKTLGVRVQRVRMPAVSARQDGVAIKIPINGIETIEVKKFSAIRTTALVFSVLGVIALSQLARAYFQPLAGGR